MTTAAASLRSRVAADSRRNAEDEDSSTGRLRAPEPINWEAARRTGTGEHFTREHERIQEETGDGTLVTVLRCTAVGLAVLALLLLAILLLLYARKLCYTRCIQLFGRSYIGGTLGARVGASGKEERLFLVIGQKRDSFNLPTHV